MKIFGGGTMLSPISFLGVRHGLQDTTAKFFRGIRGCVLIAGRYSRVIQRWGISPRLQLSKGTASFLSRKVNGKMPKLELDFEQVEDYDGRMHYTCPNEDAVTWRQLVGRKKLTRAAGVCSGGEIGLFSILPRVSEELILVDHSKVPLACAILKSLLIQDVGFDGAVELFQNAAQYRVAYAGGGYGGYVSPYAPPSSLPKRDDNYDDTRAPLEKELKKLKKYVPKTLLSAWDQGVGYYDSYTHRSSSRPSRGDHYFMGGIGAMLPYWTSVPEKERRLIEDKISLVRFVHGSMTDLHDRGPFDLFYLSNAGEGGNGNRTRPDLSKITACVRPGGYIISTRLYSRNSTAGWKLLNTRIGFGWEQCVYQVPRKKKEVVV